jgi:hypothetical protein
MNLERHDMLVERRQGTSAGVREWHCALAFGESAAARRILALTVLNWTEGWRMLALTDISPAPVFLRAVGERAVARLSAGAPVAEIRHPQGHFRVPLMMAADVVPAIAGQLSQATAAVLLSSPGSAERTPEKKRAAARELLSLGLLSGAPGAYSLTARGMAVRGLLAGLQADGINGVPHRPKIQRLILG